MRAAAAVCVLVACASAAAAQESKVARRVDDLNRGAMEDYDLLELDGAKKQLNEALALLKKARLDRSPAAAKTHMNLGIVYGAGLGDHDTALLEFVAALQIDPGAKLAPAYKSPALQKTFDQAKTTVGGKAAGGGTTEPTTPKAEPLLRHTPVDEAPGGEPIILTVKVAAEIADRASQVVARYRPAGTEQFQSINMRPAGAGEYQAAIPESATRADTLQYFIEARAATGKVLATTGSVDAPHIVTIQHAVARRNDEEPPDTETPLGSAPRGGGTPTTMATAAAPPPVAHKTFFVGLTVGAGGGYIKGETEVSHQSVTCCVAVAPFHVMPEVGFWLSQSFTLSVVARIGFPLGANVSGKATLAPAALARATYIFGRHKGAYLHGDLGGGLIRHVVKLSTASATTAMGDTDTYATGPLLVGGGAGYLFPIGGSLRFVIDLNVLAGIPVVSKLGSDAKATKPGFAINADLSLGMLIAF
jgi:hypothetical protein